MTDFNLYFPENIHPQGWITDFITPYIRRSGINRSPEANIFYDKQFTEESAKILRKSFGNEAEYQDFVNRRFNQVDESKFLFLNANWLDNFENNMSFKDTKLTPEENRKYMSFMSSAKPHQLAFLQSYMKLSYGYKEKERAENYTFIDFPFSQKFDEDFILNNNAMNAGLKYVRSEGCGIKRVNIKNDFNFVTHVNSRISIDFFFGNMKILTNEIDEKGIPADKKNNKLKYPNGFNFLKLVTSFDLSKEVLRLEYGRKVAPGFEEQVDNDLSLRSIIERREKKVLYLNMINYKFDFTENGVINLSAEYLDLGTTAFLYPNNILTPAEVKPELLSDIGKYQKIIKNHLDLTLRKKEIELEIRKLKETIDEVSKNFQKEIPPGTNYEQIIASINNDLRLVEKQTEDVQKQLKEIFETIILDSIKNQGQMFSLDFNTEKKDDKYLANMNIYLVKPKDGNFLKLFEVNKSYDLASYNNHAATKNINVDSSILENLFKKYLNTPDNEDPKETKKHFGNIMFFPLKALFSVAYSYLSKQDKDVIPYFLIGNTYIQYNNKTLAINMGDLLVERDTFQTWFYKICTSKDIQKYSFGAFLSDIINGLIPEVIYNHKTELNTTSISAIKVRQYNYDSNVSEEMKNDLYLTEDSYNFLDFEKHISLNPDNTHNKNIIYFSAINSIASGIQEKSGINDPSKFIYDELQDFNSGILHVKLGADSGLIKSVSFDVHDNSKIRSAFAIESLANTASRVLVFYYAMNLSMLGNNTFQYDSLICVPLNSLGLGSPDSDPGISGYYKILSTTDTIDENYTYNTTANGVWVRSPQNDIEESLMKPYSSKLEKIKDYFDLSVNSFNNYISEKVITSTEAQPKNASQTSVNDTKTGSSVKSGKP